MSTHTNVECKRVCETSEENGEYDIGCDYDVYSFFLLF